MSEVAGQVRHGQANALIAWRAWGLRRRIVERPVPGGSHRITYWARAMWGETTVSDEWLPNRTPHANCRRKRNRHKVPEVPHPECMCGYSAYPSVDDLVWELCRIQPGFPIVIGEVALWGRVLRSPWLRAEFAYPRSFYVIADAFRSEDSEFLPEELKLYDVPVHHLVWHEFRGVATRAFRELYEALYREVHSLVMEDDPLGLIPVGEADEYDHLVPATMTELTNADSPINLRDILLRHFHRHGAPQDWRPPDHMVDTMWQAWQDYLKNRPVP